MQRHLRLKSRADFQRLRAGGRTWRQQALMMSIAPNQLPHNRYGFIVSRRLGRAVIRNRIRRRLRACIQSCEVHIKPGYDIVFITRQPAATLRYTALCEVVVELMRDAKIWNEQR
ncbi:MAG TPA: ribonuclease P protein component [Aggregatilineales bacterium]|nr:ribonuclease P protein component [Aggregatilineales bacterium]